MGIVCEEDLKFNHCHHYWTLQVQSRCQSTVGSPHCQSLLQIPCLTLGLMLRQVIQVGTRLLIQTDSSCSRCPTALSQTAAVPSSSLLDGHCQSHHPLSLQSAVGFLPHCRSGSCPHRSHCQTQSASCGHPRPQTLIHCLFGVCMGISALINVLLNYCFQHSFECKIWRSMPLPVFSYFQSILIWRGFRRGDDGLRLDLSFERRRHTLRLGLKWERC